MYGTLCGGASWTVGGNRAGQAVGGRSRALTRCGARAACAAYRLPLPFGEYGRRKGGTEKMAGSGVRASATGTNLDEDHAMPPPPN